MATLQRKQNGDYIIVGPAYPGGGMCTWQVTPTGLEQLQRAGVSIGNRVPPTLLAKLQERGLIDTGGSGVGTATPYSPPPTRPPFPLRSVSPSETKEAPPPVINNWTRVQGSGPGRQDLEPCPHCGNAVKNTNLQRHIQKVHPQIAKQAASANSVKKEARELASASPPASAFESSPALRAPIILRQTRQDGWSSYHRIDGQAWGSFNYPSNQAVKCAICGNLITKGWFAAVTEGGSPHICSTHVTILPG